MTKKGEEIPESELKHRVIHSLLLAAVKLAREFRVPLKEMTGWVETAYFQELRQEGLTLKETADALGVSHRSAVRLSKEVREQFLNPETHHNLPRRIEFILGSGAKGKARLHQVLPEVSKEQISEALDQLLAEERIREVKGRTLMFEVVTNVRRLPRDTWMARIGALNSMVENLANVSLGRFFKKEEEKVFARTVSFPVKAENLGDLKKLYEEKVFPELQRISDEAEQSDEQVSMQLSLCWAPYEYIKNERGES